MLISGLIRFSLIDFPGYFSCIVFTGGCNFRCGFCHNGPIVLSPKKEMDEEDFLSWLESKKGKLEAVVITGGEPCMHEDLPEFVKRIKEMGFLVKVDTNGSFPEMLKELEKIVDYIAMDLKAPLQNYKKITGFGEVEKILESVEILLNGRTPYEFRTTVVPTVIGEREIEEIGEVIKGARLWALQQFVPADTVISEEYKKLNPYPPEFLKHLADIAGRYVERVVVRGV